MPLIKRYPNRKLYDTEAKQYVSLEGLRQIIRQGGEIQVIDHASGEDLTAATLVQIIHEQEKLQRGLAPLSLLAAIIRFGGEHFLPRSFDLPMSYLQEFEQEARRRIQQLIRQGELLEEEGLRLLEKLLSTGQPILADAQEKGDRAVERLFAAMGLPSRADLEQIHNQLDILTKQLERLSW